jgi:hypothetical protein
MKKIFVLLLFFPATLLHAQSDWVKPSVWVRADSTLTGADCWRDVSGNGRHLYPRFGLLPDTFSRINFNRSFSMERGSALTLPSLSLPDHEVTVMAVYQVSDTPEENALWSLAWDSTARLGLTTQRILCEQGNVRYADSNRLRPVVNTLRQGWASDYGEATLSLGRCDSLSFEGKMAECLVFDGRISDTLLIQYISYLSVKYGVTLFETNYLSSSLTVIWDYENYPDYCCSIGGIGRDPVFGLEQKQSCLLEGNVTVGLGSPAETNEENRALLHPGDYLLWGFDSALLNRCGSIFPAEGTPLDVYGNGLLQATGEGSSLLNTFLQVEASQWAEKDEENTYCLLIDRSGTGDFLPGHTEYYLPSSGDSPGRLYFSDLYWDTDRNGKDRFCFASVSPDSLFTGRSGMVHGGGNGNHGIAGNRNSKPVERGDLQARVNGESSEACVNPENSYLLYPNPNRGEFWVEADCAEVSDITIRTYSPDGKLTDLWKGFNRSSYRYEGYASVRGQYLIEIESVGERKTLKMIVQ